MLTQHRRTADVAAMSVRLARGCGSLGVPVASLSHAWVVTVCQWRQLKRGSRLTGMKAAGVGLRLFGGARRIEMNQCGGELELVQRIYYVVCIY